VSKLVILLAGAVFTAGAAGFGADYAVVVSRKTNGDAEWQRVVAALVQQHHATVVTYESSVTEALPALRRQFPRYACFVAQPVEARREFVAAVHRMTRQFDDDPYPDCFWGILTGYNAANALRIARWQKPLVVHKVAGGTDVALAMCDEGVWYCELNQGRMVKKEPRGAPLELKGPADTTEALVKTLNDYQAGLFVTSGHATEHDWQIGYRYRNGQLRCTNGVLYGLDTQGRRHPIQSPNPKLYLPVGNCLMGHIDGPEAMALAFLNSGGVNQMIGYTVTSWYGYAGWGCLDYFLEQPGRYTFAEAFFANQAALLHRLQSDHLSDADREGLLYDRDMVAFYGDPAWEARMADHDNAWDQKLTEHQAEFTFEIRPRWGAQSFAPVNTNGSQRGGRPMIEFFPHRLKNITVTEGQDLRPVVTSKFILVPNPGRCDPHRVYRIKFRADRAEARPR
jgi:zinc protease